MTITVVTVRINGKSNRNVSDDNSVNTDNQYYDNRDDEMYINLILKLVLKLFILTVIIL